MKQILEDLAVKVAETGKVEPGTIIRIRVPLEVDKIFAHQLWIDVPDEMKANVSWDDYYGVTVNTLVGIPVNVATTNCKEYLIDRLSAGEWVDAVKIPPEPGLYLGYSEEEDTVREVYYSHGMFNYSYGQSARITKYRAMPAKPKKDK